MENINRVLVIGAGEVGTSLTKVLSRENIVTTIDKKPISARDVGTINVMHVCFPYFDGFVDTVKEYATKYFPKFTIIHSTVPVGTTRKLGPSFVHSPIHGRHPNMVKGILTYAKYVGGIDEHVAIEAVRHLRGSGISAAKVDSPETSELSKILCTTRLGLDVVYMQETKRMCDKYGADFEMVYGWHELYNNGVIRSGTPKLSRSVLNYTPGKTGGHCVTNNCKLMPDEPLMKFFLERDETYGENV